MLVDLEVIVILSWVFEIFLVGMNLKIWIGLCEFNVKGLVLFSLMFFICVIFRVKLRLGVLEKVK